MNTYTSEEIKEMTKSIMQTIHNENPSMKNYIPFCMFAKKMEEMYSVNPIEFLCDEVFARDIVRELYMDDPIFTATIWEYLASKKMVYEGIPGKEEKLEKIEAAENLIDMFITFSLDSLTEDKGR